jgi:hypothetical protein
VPVSSYAYVEGPAIAAAALGLIVLICRWVFTTDRPSPLPAPQRADFGLLEQVALVRTAEDAQMLRELLGEAGIRGTVTELSGRYAVLVFGDDTARARELVRS